MQIFLAGGLVVLVVFYVIPAGAFNDLAYYPSIGLASAVAILVGIHMYRPAYPLPWFLFAAGQVLFAVGDEIDGIYSHVLHDDSFPTPADLFYLAGYPALALGLWLLVRQRTTGRDWEALIDAAIVTVALGVVAWEALMLPFTRDDSLSVLEKLVSIAYPLGDVLLLAVAVRLLLGSGIRVIAYWYLSGALVCLLVADPLYALVELTGRYGSGSALDAGWILSYMLFGAAALHPSMRDIHEPAVETAPKLTPLRLALLAAAALTSPIVLAFRPEYTALAGAAVLFLLVLARLAGIVRRHERAVERESRLREAAATLVGATSDEEIDEAALATAAGFAGSGSRVTLVRRTAQGLSEVASADEEVAGQTVTRNFPLQIRGEWRGELQVRSVEELRIEDRNALDTLADQLALAHETVARAREQAERASEARFRSLVQNSTDVISIVSPDTSIRWLTPSVETTFGYEGDTLVDHQLSELVHPDDAARVREACGDAAASGELRALEFRVRHAGGAWLETETVVSPRLDDETIGGLVLTTRDVTERKRLEAADAERARVRDMFSRFVPEAVADQLLAEGGTELRLGGETMNGTIMFTDLRSFTTFSESRAAGEVIAVINHFLSEQTDAIMAHGGTIIAYLGDGLMAAFGAPIEQADHADRALAASRELIGERLPLLNEWMRNEGYGDGFRMGIGLNSGPFISGNVGNERRLEYTAIGDVCNTASRIEGLTKGTRHMLLFSETTLEDLRRRPDDLVDFGDTAIRGRQAAARLWSLEGISDDGA